MLLRVKRETGGYDRAVLGPADEAELNADTHPYWWFWGHSEIRDDRIALFADSINNGTYEYTYIMRASVAGTFNALPARAYPMYDPMVLGQSAGSLFTITP